MGLSADSTIQQILDDPKGKAVLQKHWGDEALNNPQLAQAMGFSLRMVQGFVEGQAPGTFTKEMLDAVDADLKAL